MMLKKLFSSSLALMLFLSSLATIWPVPASALSGSQFRAGRITDDSIFFNSGTMEVAHIQAFLNAKVPVCETNHSSSDPANQPPFTCLKDYRQDTPNRGAETGLCNAYSGGNKTSAQIIFDISRACGINPQVMIVLLQKEQSLITDTWPWNIQYRSATGFGCPDTAPCDAEYYGFFNQVYAAARQFKRYIRDAHLFNYRAGLTNNIQYHPNAACGSSGVYIESRSTAALYNYTPYQPNAAALQNLYGTGNGCSAYGNRNFWRLFNDWFGPTTGTVLLRGSSPTVFVVGANPDYVYPVASGEVLKAYGLDRTPITPVSDAYLATLDTDQMLTTLFMQPNDGTIFLADSGRKIGISSGTFCTAWNLPCGVPSAVAQLPYAVSGGMPSQTPLTNIMLNGSSYFLMDNGKRRPFPEGTSLGATSWATTNVTLATSPLNNTQTVGIPAMPDNRFFGVKSNGAIYFCAANCNSLGVTPNYYTFGSFEVFKAWWNGSFVLGDKFSSFNSSPPSATVLRDFVTYNTATYIPNGNNKILLPTNPVVSATNVTNASELSQVFTTKQTVTIDDTKAFQLPSGSINTVRSNNLLPIPTLSDLFLSFSPENIMPVPANLATVYPTDKLFIVPGRIFKPNDSSAMYLYGSDSYLWALGNITELTASLAWVNQVINAPFSMVDHDGIKIFTATIKMNSNYYAVQADGSIRPLPTAILTGSRDTYAMPLSGVVAQKPSVDNRIMQFIRFDNGTIFKVESNSIRPLSSMATYNSLGGNLANTTQVSVKAAPMFTIGSPL